MKIFGYHIVRDKDFDELKVSKEYGLNQINKHTLYSAKEEINKWFNNLILKEVNRQVSYGDNEDVSAKIKYIGQINKMLQEDLKNIDK